jgi:aryl-alcohol dehydrogenase-like predicted oxidoreductase
MRQLAKERYRRYLTKGNFMLVDQIKEFAFERGRHPVEVALVWLLKRPMVSTVFPGATRPDQVRLNAAAGGWVLTPDEVAELNSIVEVAPT